MPYQTLHRPSSSIPQSTDRVPLNLLGHLLKHVNLFQHCIPNFHSFHDHPKPSCPLPTCELLFSLGARYDIVNARQETALLLARKNGSKNDAEKAILNESALKLVLGGSHVKKHTKWGKGAPHSKVLIMVGAAGILRWGKSSKRNVICRKAEVGPSDAFRWNRRRKFDCDEPGMFHVVTTKNKELHFVCEGGSEMAELWVRGIKLVTMKAIFGKNE